MMDALREAREAAGVSQKALSKKLKRTENYINLVENGWRIPDLCEFILIVQSFGGDPSQLVERIQAAGKRRR